MFAPHFPLSIFKTLLSFALVLVSSKGIRINRRLFLTGKAILPFTFKKEFADANVLQHLFSITQINICRVKTRMFLIFLRVFKVSFYLHKTFFIHSNYIFIKIIIKFYRFTLGWIFLQIKKKIVINDIKILNIIKIKCLTIF